MTRQQFILTYEGVNQQLYHKALVLLRSRDEAADAVQEVLAKLWEKRDKLEDVANPAAYAMQMVKNYSLDRLKSKQASQLHVVDDIPIEDDCEADEELMRNQRVKMVREMIAKLSDKERQLIELRDIKQYDMEAIQKEMGLKPTAARVALSRARKALKKELEKGMNR